MHLPTHHNLLSFFFLNDTAPTEIYPLPLHDALPISRRAFIKGAGAAAAAVASLGAAVASADAADAAGEVANSDGVIGRPGPGAHTFQLNPNGREVQVTAEPRGTLLNVLRGQLGLTGTTPACDRGACGPCSVP